MTEVLLRPPAVQDIDALWAMMNRPAVRHGTGRTPFTARAWVESRVTANNPLVTSVVADLGGVAVGWASIMRGEGRHSHKAEFGISVHDAYHRKGIGRALMGALIDVADNWLGLTRIVLNVNFDNHGAIALYRSFGFEEEGRLRADILRDGVLIDTIVMGRLRPAPQRFTGASDDAAS